MALASCGKDGQPSVRMVLLKEHGLDGFVFYTNIKRRKGEQLAANQKAALLFHWKSLRRQVRLEGAVVPVSTVEADAYFASRPREAQLGAWASQQSRPLASRDVLKEKVVQTHQQFEGKAVPRPAYWSGYRLLPLFIEFWQEQPFRLHDRVIYSRGSAAESWSYARQYP
jgi:pyridoxamine 5'-phosphate oxidase